MIRSMTGYGRSELTFGNKTVSVEIKTVNHRYNDMFIRIPRQMNTIEGKIRESVSKIISRGKIDLYVKYENKEPDSKTVTTDETLIKAYLQIFETINRKFGIENDISMSAISKIPDVMTVTNSDETEEEMLAILMPALEDAMNSLVHMRETEGLQLKNNIIDNLNALKDQLYVIKERAPMLPGEYRNKLRARLADLMNGEIVDENRIAAEISIMADRCCVDEEISRLESHFGQVEQTLHKDSGQIGKKLDFLTQELNREVNTIGSKANDLSITNHIVEMKCAIEKIREQVQNIE